MPGRDQGPAAVVTWCLPASPWPEGRVRIRPGPVGEARSGAAGTDEQMGEFLALAAGGGGTRALPEPAGQAVVPGAHGASRSLPGGLGHGRPPGSPILTLRDHWRAGPADHAAYVHNIVYTTGFMEETQSQLSVRDARAHFAEVVSRAEGGTPTVITRNGRAIAAVVPIEDYDALEDAIDRYFAQQADRDLADNPDAPAYSMSQVVAAIFEEEPGKGVA